MSDQTEPLASADEGFETVRVCGLPELIEALDRAARKGYMPDAITKAWDQFDYHWPAATPPMTPGVPPLTYTNQPTNNVEAWRLGEACRKAAEEPKCGDYIDRGLILLRELEARGYGITRLEPAGSSAQAEDSRSNIK